MKLDYENSHTKEMEQSSINPISKIKSFEEILSDFYRLKYNTEISDEELEIMLEVAREAGVYDETN